MHPWRAYMKLKHLLGIGAVPFPTVMRGLLHLYPDYLFGRGYSKSFMNLTLELTYRCNWACEFCFLRNNLLYKSGPELSETEILGIVDQAAALRLGVFITGGEPFIREDAVSIIRGIKERGLRVGANTNHHLLDPDKIDALIECGMDYLIVSVHGPREVHDRLTGVECFERVMTNLQHWRKREHNTCIILNFVLTPDNAAYAEDVVRIGGETGVSMVCMQHASYLTDRERELHYKVWRDIFGTSIEPELSHLSMAASSMPLGAMAAHLEQARKVGNQIGVRVFVKPDLHGEELAQWYGDDFRYGGKCSYLYTDIRVDPFGNVVVCQPIPSKIGNIREASLLALANSPRMAAVRNGIKRAGGMFPACTRCCKMYRSF